LNCKFSARDSLALENQAARRIDTAAGLRISKESHKHAHLDNGLFSADKSRPVTVTAATGHFAYGLINFMILDSLRATKNPVRISEQGCPNR